MKKKSSLDAFLKSLFGAVSVCFCPRKRLRAITEDDFLRVKEKNSYWKGRWDYISEVARMIEAVAPFSALEIGPRELPVIQGSDVLDMTDEHFGKLKYLHNATKVPWPIKDKQYDLVVALQVWEHLKGRQREAFGEVMRVSRKAILSFPFKWQCNPKDCHYNIDEAQISEWTLGVKPVDVKLAAKRIIYHFVF